MANALFTEEALIIPLSPEAYDINAALECNSFHMKNYNHATVVLYFSDALTGNNVLTVECGATDSADTADLTFHYRLAAGVNQLVNSDVLAADATAATLTLTDATYQGRILVLEWSADELPTVADVVYDWCTVDLDGAAAVGTATIIAILTEPRDKRAIMRTAIV